MYNVTYVENIKEVLRKMAFCSLETSRDNTQISNSKYFTAKVGDTVKVRMPDVNRARTDGRNIINYSI